MSTGISTVNRNKDCHTGFEKQKCASHRFIFAIIVIWWLCDKYYALVFVCWSSKAQNSWRFTATVARVRACVGACVSACLCVENILRDQINMQHSTSNSSINSFPIIQQCTDHLESLPILRPFLLKSQVSTFIFPCNEPLTITLFLS